MSKVLTHYGTVFKFKDSCIAAIENGTSHVTLGIRSSYGKVRYDLPMYHLLGRRGEHNVFVAVEQEEEDASANPIVYRTAAISENFPRGTPKKETEESTYLSVIEKLRTPADFDRVLAQHPGVDEDGEMDDFREVLLRTKQYCELRSILATKRLLITFQVHSWKRQDNGPEATMLVDRIAAGQVYGFITTEVENERYRQDTCDMDAVRSWRTLEPNEIEELLVSSSQTVRSLVHNDNYPVYKEAQKKVRRLKYMISQSRTRLQKAAHKLLLGRFFTRIKDRELRANVVEDYKQTLRSVNWELIDRALAELDRPLTEGLVRAENFLASKGAKSE